MTLLARENKMRAFGLACVDGRLLYTITAGSDRHQFIVGHVKVRNLNMAEKTEEKAGGRKVLIAIDGSEHGDRAFDCKFFTKYRAEM